MKNKRNRQPAATAIPPKPTATMPHLVEIQGLLDSLTAKLESLPGGQGRAIWKNVIHTVRDDVKKFEQKLLEDLPPMSTVERV
ncbi:MAG: hypothetical protein L0Z48_01855 [candidate division Zixibacteria bacterium]|nr:hypothetical protein [candidate division Zixibacteria bacterium]MCI0595268.1 hypothetical protein [candidate division Zixibacteria bacterium]